MLAFEVDRRSTSSSGGDLILPATDGGKGRVINACIRKLLLECVLFY